MAPFLAAALPIIKNIAPSIVSGILGMKGAEKQNEAQLASAREQMAFQERMSSTAHQREVEDLRKAGLNPILSGTGGAGSATPSGAQASMVNELGAGVSSALEARRLKAQIEQIQTQTELLKAGVPAAKAQAEGAQWLIDKAKGEGPGIIQQARDVLSGTVYPAIASARDSAASAVADVVSSAVEKAKQVKKTFAGRARDALHITITRGVNR